MADLSILKKKIRSYFDCEDAADIEAEDYQVQSQSSDPHSTKTSSSETKTSSYVQRALGS